MKIERTAATMLLAFSMLNGVAAFAAPAMADDHAPVEIYCFNYNLNGQEVTECETVENLKAECKLSDPGNTTDVCQDVNSLFPARDDRPQSLSDGGSDEDQGGVSGMPRPGNLINR